MRTTNKLLLCIIGGILGFLLIGWGYILFIGKPITLNQYFSANNVSSMKISLENDQGIVSECKELTKDELDGFINKFGFYKIFKPFFRRTFIAKKVNSQIVIYLSNKDKTFEVIFPLTDQGMINLMRYTFYPYKDTHPDMYQYLTNLID